MFLIIFHIEVKVHVWPTGGSRLHQWSEIYLWTWQKPQEQVAVDQLLYENSWAIRARTDKQQYNENPFFIHQKVQYKFPDKCNL